MKESHERSSAAWQPGDTRSSVLESALKRPSRHRTGGDGDVAVDSDDMTDTTAEKEKKPQKNDGADDTITVLAHVKEKIIPVHCGFGTQQVLWLGHVAIARYDEERDCQGWLELGVPTKIVKDDAKHELKLTDLICDVLPNSSHVYISTSLG